MVDTVTNCPFCQIPHQRVVRTFNHCYAIRDGYPVTEGHTLIIPYVHTENCFTAKEEVRVDMMEALQSLKEDLDLEYQPDGYNIGLNCGEPAGQTVMHLHLHLIPRYKGDTPNPRGGVRGVIPAKQSY